MWGKLMPAVRSRRMGGLPIGLAHGCRLTRPVAAGACVCRADVALDERQEIVRVRDEMERAFGPSLQSDDAAVAE